MRLEIKKKPLRVVSSPKEIAELIKKLDIDLGMTARLPVDRGIAYDKRAKHQHIRYDVIVDPVSDFDPNLFKDDGEYKKKEKENK